jgi:hypothetical protein
MTLPTTYNGMPIIPDQSSHQPVRIRPCTDNNPNNETFDGVYLGRVDLGGFMSRMPAIWVEKFQKIVLGCESWWGFTKTQGPNTAIPPNDVCIEQLLKHIATKLGKQK